MPWQAWKEWGDTMVYARLRVSERVSAWPLGGLRGCSRSQRSGTASSGVELCEDDRLIPVLTVTCYPKQSEVELVLPTSMWQGTVALQRVIEATAVLGVQQRLPAQALAGCAGAPSSRTTAPRTAHRFDCGAGSEWWSRERRLGCPRSPGLSAPALGWHSSHGRRLDPRESAGHLSPRFAGTRRYPGSQGSVAWEQVNGNAKLCIRKYCRHCNGALVRSNWKMCPLLFNFWMSLLQHTACKEGNLQMNHWM